MLQVLIKLDNIIIMSVKKSFMVVFFELVFMVVNMILRLDHNAAF